jgi:hypothetical protein
MPRKLLLFVVTVVLLFSNAFVAAAKPLQWQDATVLVAGGLPTSGVRRTLALYWIKTDKITYVVSNSVSDYSKGLFMERWLVLTAGGPTKIAIDGTNIHVIDEEGKDRKVPVVWKIATKP